MLRTEQQSVNFTNYRYTSLADATKFIDAHKPPDLDMQEALRRVQAAGTGPISVDF